ncbi:MAG: NADH-quinone oxidoreductase subunit NuoG, partial [Alphaproteobacteria bacterium]
LLVNHPLDCPICDQGGECDLQDQTMAYGTSSNRYEENKRAVEDKNMGPLVSTIMTRCIHCTRCVRFTEEVAGVGEIGAIGRGEDMEITTYLEANLSSELSANVIDLCPVGALTSRPYAFNARPWELRKTESVDVMDAMGAAIRIDVRGREVMRVLPRLNEEINEEWISDKTRYACDGLKYQRLDRPYVKGPDGKLAPAEWDEALAVAAEKIKGTDAAKVAALAGDLQDAESMKALKDLMGQIGSANLDCRPAGSALDGTNRASYLFNAGIAGVEDADAILLIGTNPRLDAPVLNARIRKRWLEGGLQVGVIGEDADLTYKTTHLGAGPQTLADLVAGNHSFVEVLKNASNPLIILGEGAVTRADGAQVLGAARALAESVNAITEDWNGYSLLHSAASRVGGLDMGFVPGEGGMDAAAIAAGGADVVIALGADEIDLSQSDAFIIYIGTHGDNGAHLADVILPAASYAEKDGTYVNMEGRVQRGFRAAFPPGDAKEDWAIIRALS